MDNESKKKEKKQVSKDEVKSTKRGRGSSVQRNGSGQANLFLGKLQPSLQPSPLCRKQWKLKCPASLEGLLEKQQRRDFRLPAGK